MADEYVTKAVHDLEIQRLKDEETRQNRRIDALENKGEALSDLAASVKVLANNMESMAKEQAKITSRLDDLEAEPAENWKKAVWIVIGAVIAACVGLLLRGMGL